MPQRPLTGVDERLVALEHLDVGTLAKLVGQRIDALVHEQLQREGFKRLGPNQLLALELLGTDGRSVSEVGVSLGISQQAASKIIATLRRAQLLEPARAEDLRERPVRLSSTGRHLLTRIRTVRSEHEHELARVHGARNVAQLRRFLMSAVDQLGAFTVGPGRRVQSHG